MRDCQALRSAERKAWRLSWSLSLGTVVGFYFSALYISEQKVIFFQMGIYFFQKQGRKPERAECFSKV